MLNVYCPISSPLLLMALIQSCVEQKGSWSQFKFRGYARNVELFVNCFLVAIKAILGNNFIHLMGLSVLSFRVVSCCMLAQSI